MAPEYANTGMLNEKSDIYSFGVLLLEAVTGRDPVDYNRVSNEVLMGANHLMYVLSVPYITIFLLSAVGILLLI